MCLRKILVLSTAAIVLFALAAMAIASSRSSLLSIEITSPVFGNRNAPIEVVVFEDFKCHGCRLFSETVLPQLESEYLATQKIQLKVIPLGFLKDSKILANAALEIYQLSPERFLSYAKRLFDRLKEETSSQILLDLAKEMGGIDLSKLKTCIDQKCHYGELDQNLQQARSLMGKNFRIPALYVNGVRVETADFQAIRQEIDRVEL